MFTRWVQSCDDKPDEDNKTKPDDADEGDAGELCPADPNGTPGGGGPNSADYLSHPVLTLVTTLVVYMGTQPTHI